MNQEEFLKHLKGAFVRPVDKPRHHLIKYFDDYLGCMDPPQELQALSGQLRTVAVEMDLSIPSGTEKDAGMRKLLEARDCFCRAVMFGENQ